MLHIPPSKKVRKEKFVQEHLQIEEYPFEEPPKEEKLEEKNNRGVVIIDLF